MIEKYIEVAQRLYGNDTYDYRELSYCYILWYATLRSPSCHVYIILLSH